MDARVKPLLPHHLFQSLDVVRGHPEVAGEQSQAGWSVPTSSLSSRGGRERRREGERERGGGEGGREGERGGGMERETDRQKEGEREREREREGRRERERDRQTDRQTDRERERERWSSIDSKTTETLCHQSDQH